jgi:hypothetical protein
MLSRHGRIQPVVVGRRELSRRASSEIRIAPAAATPAFFS